MEQLVQNAEGNLSIRNIQPPTKRKPTALLSREEKQKQQQVAEARKKYGRGRPVRLNQVKDKKLRSRLRHIEDKYQDAILGAKDAEILLENQEGFLQPESELERTYKVRQDDITEAIGVQQAKKSFELKLDLGPYTANYTRNGKQLLLAGQKGHIATCDWRSGRPGCELNLNETVRDAKWLHNDQYFAVAQKKHVYIYDAAGVEIHVLRKYVETSHLEFLPYHFLLAGVENSGFLRYTDTSTGQIVAEHPTRKGPPTALAQNPYNAILHVGHQNGTVSLWSPNSTDALVKIQANAGAVRSIAVDRSGHYMLTGGQDSKLKLWDIRALKEVHSYSTRQPATSISVSDRGLAAIVTNTSVTIWKDLFSTGSSNEPGKVQSPYLNYHSPLGAQSKPNTVSFCPFDDVLGVSHTSGFSSLVVPGAGEPNYDALELNPYETRVQRREAEVKSLLTKLQPETIALDPNFVGTLDIRSAEDRAREKDLDAPSREEEKLARLKERNRGRGKNSALRRHLRKKGGKNIVDEKRVRMEQMRHEKAEREKERITGEKMELGPALSRFVGGSRQ
ncbi:putative U3 small nucleolar RNA-associated protein 7 [Knufia obscura]|uniref:U three protein 7 n=2 Tax=Knufia TaxID=430999 RepID=A0AAN8F7X9_9EURO|nr:putative U3 small nucleolar RNA-associated protein 7 [Knufia obscura]KAK5958648.1 putative U3 small nucleolar RNA-associated protein 7 [Knufia fluminis]